jgi:hypothetical protein
MIHLPNLDGQTDVLILIKQFFSPKKGAKERRWEENSEGSVVPTMSLSSFALDCRRNSSVRAKHASKLSGETKPSVTCIHDCPIQKQETNMN